MASLLTEPLFEISGRAPPPNKNFYHFSVTKSDVSIGIFLFDKNSPPSRWCVFADYSRALLIVGNSADAASLDDLNINGNVSELNLRQP